MTKYYGDLNARYYGNEVSRDPQIGLEWSRIPHFYYNFYVYQYATGFAAATTLANGITHGSKENVQEYLNYLSAGSANYPIEVMKSAGVNMTQSTYLEKAFDTFEKRLDEFEKIIENN